MKYKIILWTLLLVVVSAALYCTDALLSQRALAEKTVRLHVIANSDSAEDQAQKLRVRDAVLRKAQELTANCRNAKEARRILAAQAETLCQAAQAVLLKEESPYPVTVEVGEERFNTRYYETFTLPAGEYPSLCVRIGAAEGKNWWCVVFPSLCTAATGESLERCAAVGGMDSAETRFITEGEETYTLRFKTLEWLQKIAELFS